MNTVTLTTIGLTAFGLACILFSRVMERVFGAIRKASDTRREEWERRDRQIKDMNDKLIKVIERLGRLDVMNDKIILTWDRLGDIEKMLEGLGNEK